MNENSEKFLVPENMNNEALVILKSNSSLWNNKIPVKKLMIRFKI